MDALQGTNAELNPVDDLFAEFEAATSGKNTAAKEKIAPVKEEKSVKKKSGGKSKMEKAVAEETKETQKPEPKKQTIDPDKIVYIDLQNSDDRKTVMELMQEGKILSDANNQRQFVLSFNTKHPYNISNPPVHRIYVDEIIHMSMYTYYKDMHTFEAGKRELVRKVYWVYHKGWSTHDMIDEVTFNMLKDEGLVKDITYTFIDVLAGRSYWAGNSYKEPSIAEVIEKDEKEDQIEDEMRGRKRSKTVLPPSMKAPIAPIGIGEESLPPVEETNTLPDLLAEDKEGGEKDGIQHGLLRGDRDKSTIESSDGELPEPV